jgi:hypothetical protein
MIYSIINMEKAPIRQFVEINGQLIARDQFGNGAFGTRIWNTIIGGIPCETLLEDTSICGKPAIGTVDFDVNGDPDSVYICSEDHAHQVSTKILHDLNSHGRETVLGRNGNGRENAKIRDIDE